MATRPAVRYRAGDIWDTPDDGNRYEVIDGELYVTPPPLEKHQGATGVLGFAQNVPLRCSPEGAFCAG